MDVRTYRAPTMQEALNLVRRDLGRDAAVLHTREVHAAGLWRLIPRSRRIEITAAADVNVPSRLPAEVQKRQAAASHARNGVSTQFASAGSTVGQRDQVGNEMKQQLNELQGMVEDLCRRYKRSGHDDLPEELFYLYTELIDADVSEELARELVERIHRDTPGAELNDRLLVKARMARMIEAEITASGPIVVSPPACHLVALVGPTGVGKTTTIAKLAAHYRLREKRKVGLVTVDTYRIAAVEQLRTYADIIDLPMEVVSSPREMRPALERLSGMELILMDTAGRSPRDEIKIHELRALLAEAKADEVHLVLSSVTSAAGLVRTATQFAPVRPTQLLLTKLDEATSLGNLLPVLRSSNLSLSYLTNGQNVPDDIEVAEPARLARVILGMEFSESV